MLRAVDVSAHVILSLVLGNRRSSTDEALTGGATRSRSHQKVADQVFLSAHTAVGSLTD